MERKSEAVWLFLCDVVWRDTCSWYPAVGLARDDLDTDWQASPGGWRHALLHAFQVNWREIFISDLCGRCPSVVSDSWTCFCLWCHEQIMIYYTKNSLRYCYCNCEHTPRQLIFICPFLLIWRLFTFILSQNIVERIRRFNVCVIWMVMLSSAETQSLFVNVVIYLHVWTCVTLNLQFVARALWVCAGLPGGDALGKHQRRNERGVAITLSY